MTAPEKPAHGKELFMEIGAVLTRAWQITWKYKILWIFGILASCGSGGGGGNSSGGSNGNGGGSSSLFFFDSNNWRLLGQLRVALFDGLTRWVDDTSPWLVFVLIMMGLGIVALLIALTITLGTIGRIGLIQGAVKAEAGAKHLSFGELFSGGLPYFWRVLLLALLIAICAVFVAVFILVPVGIFTCGIGFLLFLPFAWFVAVLVEQASAAIVVDNLSITDGLRKGWELIRDNLGIMIVMSLILYLLLGLLVGVILALPAVLMATPLILAGVMAAIAQTPFVFGGGVIVTLILLGLYIPVIVLVSGVLRTYIGTSWTLTYMNLNKPMIVVD
jgi:hypothetical protein